MISSVVVTDGDQRAALAAVRSLGRAGYEVHVCAVERRSIAGSSRYSASQTAVADPLRYPAVYADDVVRLAENTGSQVVLPVSEPSLLALLPQRDRFRAAIPFSSADSFTRICDKREVLDLARKHGIAVPSQVVVQSREKADEIARRNFSFPLVLKPSRSVAGNGGKRIRTGVSYAASAHELLESLESIPESAYPVLLQQRIEGEGFAHSVLLWDGRLYAAFAHQRIREKPPSGGVSVLRKSIHLDDELLAKSLDLLSEFDWKGVAMIEFKRDRLSGIPYLMEINGRLWGSLQLAIDAGVDFPKLLVQLALGETPPITTSYPAEVHSRWEWGEVDHLLARMRHSPRWPSTPDPGTRRKGGRSTGDSRLEVFRRDDPRPFLLESFNWLRGR